MTVSAKSGDSAPQHQLFADSQERCVRTLCMTLCGRYVCAERACPPKGEALTGLVRLFLQAKSGFLCLVGWFCSGTESQQKAKILLLRTNL